MPIFESLAIFFNITVKSLTASIDLLTVFLESFITDNLPDGKNVDQGLVEKEGTQDLQENIPREVPPPEILFAEAIKLNGTISDFAGGFTKNIA